MLRVSSFFQTRVRPLLERHWLLASLLTLTFLIVILYAPVLGMGFVTDDFIEIGARHDDALDFLAHDDLAGWAGQFVQRSLIDPVSGAEMFRPTRQAIFAADYFMWHLDARGYHITNLLLLLATCFVVLLLAWQLTRRKSAALAAGLLFALHPAHTAPISEVSSRGHVIAGLFVALTVLFYVMGRTRRNGLLALLCCALAIGSKETALVTPLLLALYEIIYHRTEILGAPLRVALRQLPFWLVTVGAIGLRLLLFGRFSNSTLGIGSWSFTYQVQGYSLFTLEPFIYDISDIQTIVFLFALVVFMLLYRARRQVWFGFLWVPLSLLVTLSSPPQERYFYTPSIGLAIAFASIVAQPFNLSAQWARRAGLVVTAALCLCLLIGSVDRAADYRNAGDIVETILAQTKTLHPTLPQNARLVFVGLPEAVRRAFVFNSQLGVQYAMQLLYADRSIKATRAETFPIALDAPGRTFFFEYERRKITERADLVQALLDRQRCSDSPQKTIVWNFDADAQGWEPWSEIEDVQSTTGALTFRTTGTDPFLGSPLIQVRPQDLQNIKIVMRAQAATPTFTGELYWQTTEMNDFSAEVRTSFPVTADNVSHTYNIKLNVAGDAPILRLRFDPADVPADIQLEQITIRCK